MPDDRTPPTPAWIPVSKALPRKGLLVLTRGESGYGSHKEFFVAAYYDAEYRPLSPWLDVTNTCLSDSGWTPTHWRRLDDLVHLPVGA